MINTSANNKTDPDKAKNNFLSRRTQSYISLIIMASFVFKLLYHAYCQAFKWDLNSYGYSEFLINYQGGFVRRGFLGEVLYIFYQTFSFPLHASIFCISYLAFIGVVLFFFKQFKKHQIYWWLIFSPLFLNFTTYIVRKDYILYGLLIGILYLLRSSSHDILKKSLACFLAVISLLIHEAFLFWGIVLYAIILLTDKRHKVLNYLFITLPLVFILAIVLSKGTTDIAYGIVNSWNAILPNHPLNLIHDNSIGAIGWDSLNTFIFHLKSNVSESLRGGGILLIPLLLIISYYLFTNYMNFFFKGEPEDRKMKRMEISLLYPILCLSLVPMLTILSCDTGRIFQYATITTFCALIIFPEQRIIGIFPLWYKNKINKFNHWLDSNFPPTKISIIFLLLTIGVCSGRFNLNSSWCESIIGSLISVCFQVGVKLAKLLFL